MKSITSKLSIIILSLLASTYTFAFDHGAVCSAMNDAVTEKQNTNFNYPVFWGPITDIYSRNTDGSDPRGEVCGTVNGFSSRVCGQSGLECSGDTCHVNKEWADCECTSSACTDKPTAIRNNMDIGKCQEAGGTISSFGIVQCGANGLGDASSEW